MSEFGGLKDFSVDAQRRMFQEQQERERQAEESKRASRNYKRASANSSTPSGVALSGLMSNLENGGAGGAGGGGGPGGGGVQRSKIAVGDDDDDSIADDWSLDSEESFYVGIERADYAQPDNLEMYGESKEEDYEIKEDRLGISRISVAIINREEKSGKRAALDWDADIPIIDSEKGSSLHEFMNGVGSGAGGKGSRSKKDVVVAMPLVGTSLEWKADGKLSEEDDAAIDQVYQHKAAEGKMFIDKLVGAPSSTPGKGGDASTVGGMVTPGPGMTPGVTSAGGVNYPVLSPMALFSPGITTARGSVVEGEDNGVRQMRERELRKEGNEKGMQKMKDLQRMIVSTKDGRGQVDAVVLMKQLERMMADFEA